MINLLPTEEKEQIKQEENWRLVLNLGISALVFLISLSLILLSVKIYVVSQLESQKVLFASEEKAFQATELCDFRTKIQGVNQILLTLESFYQDQVNSADIFQKIQRILPQGIHLDTFSYKFIGDLQDEDGYKARISLSGVALTQEALFKFKEDLDADKNFGDVVFPISSWMKFENIDFSIRFKFLQ